MKYFPTLTSCLTRRMIWAYVLLYGAAAFFSAGYHHLDEHFQILELAGWRLGIPHTPKWEFLAHIRPALQPSLVYLLYRLGGGLFHEINPFILTGLLRGFSLLLYTSALLFVLEALLRPLSPGSRRMVVWLSILIWFFPYLAVRYSSENFSRIFFLFSMLPLWYADGKEGSPPISQRIHSWIWLGAGVFAGLAFFARFQVALMTVGFFLWMIVMKRTSLKHLSLFATGVIVACLGNVLLDSWFYREWEFTPWTYFRINLLEGKAAEFGVTPWYEYFIESSRYNFPFVPVFTLFPFLFFVLYPRHILTWVTIPFLLVHFLIGHKELRFLFPMVSFLPFFTVMVWERWKGWVLTRKVLVVYFLITNALLLLIAVFRPADFGVGFLYQYLYAHRGQPVYYFNNKEKTHHTHINNGWMRWYVKEYPHDAFIPNTDIVWEEYEKNQSPVILISPTPLVKEEAINPEWAGTRPFPLPKWQYSFPFLSVMEYPRFYDFWIKSLVLPTYHVYLWEP